MPAIAARVGGSPSGGPHGGGWVRNGAIGGRDLGCGQIAELFERTLGLERPWRLDRTEFDASARQLDLFVDFDRGGTFDCPECGRQGCKAYDTTEKRWR